MYEQLTQKVVTKYVKKRMPLQWSEKYFRVKVILNEHLPVLVLYWPQAASENSTVDNKK